MKGLLYKDFASTKKETLICLLVCTIFLLFTVTTGTFTALGPTIGVVIAFGSMAPTYSLQYDKNSGWNRFICASPIPRSRVILSKYLSGLLTALFFTGIAFLANLLAGNQMPAWAFLAIPALILLLQAVVLPVCLKLGQNAVLVVFLLMIFVPIGISALLYKTGVLSDAFLNGIQAAFTASSPVLLALLFLAAAAVLFDISYLISCRFFRRMEF